MALRASRSFRRALVAGGAVGTGFFAWRRANVDEQGETRFPLTQSRSRVDALRDSFGSIIDGLAGLVDGDSLDLAVAGGGPALAPGAGNSNPMSANRFIITALARQDDSLSALDIMHHPSLKSPVMYSPGLFPGSVGAPEPSHQHPHNIAKSMQSTFLIHVDVAGPSAKPRVGPASMAKPGSLDRMQHGTGTGFLVTSHGHLLTNAHVLSPDNHTIHEATDGLDMTVKRKITVQDSRGHKYSADVVGYDSLSDLAVLKITREISELSDHAPHKFVPLPFAPLPSTNDIEEDEEIEPGTQVCTIGNPKGLAYSITSGILGSYPRPSAVLGKTDPGIDFLQTDAQVRRGNSGGPLLSLRTGHVLGVTTTSYDPVAASAGGNDLATFAIRADATVRCLLRNMLVAASEAGKEASAAAASKVLPPPPRPYLGFHSLDDALLSSLPERYEGWNGTLNGVLVMGLDKSGPAASGGLREGDLIVKVAGEKVSSEKGIYDLVYAFSPICGDIWKKKVGDRKFASVEMTVLRLKDGRPAEEKVRVEPVELASGSTKERETRVRFLASNNE